MKQSKHIRKLLTVLLAVIVMATLCCQFAFAVEGEQEVKNQATRIFSIVQTITYPAAALAAAGCGLIMIYGEESAAAKAKTALKYIIIAVVCMFLLPRVVSAVASNAGATAWDPTQLQ